jgi:UDP-N-acetylglucosamine acyltransferase
MYDSPPAEPQAMLRARAQADGNLLHPSVVIEGDVRLGKRNQILPNSILIGPLEIGDDNRIGPHAVLGTEPQNTRDPLRPSTGRVVIGNQNLIREFSAVHKPVSAPETRIGNRCYLMQTTHVAHDSILQDEVTLTTMSAVAGHTVVLRGANIAAGCCSHQHTVIGHYSMVSMATSLQRNLRPFARYIPRSPLSVNEYAIEKFGFQAYAEEIRAYVLKRERPHSAEILRIVEEFEAFHAASGRESL